LRRLDTLAHLHSQFCLGRQQHVYAGAELDQAHALAALQRVALVEVEDDAPGQKAGNLFEGDLNALAADGGDVLLVWSAEAGFMAFR